MKKKTAQRPRGFRWKRFFKISAVYFLLFIALAGMIDYYAWMAFSLTWIAALCAAGALVLGYLHVRYGKRDHVDDIADELL